MTSRADLRRGRIEGQQPKAKKKTPKLDPHNPQKKIKYDGREWTKDKELTGKQFFRGFLGRTSENSKTLMYRSGGSKLWVNIDEQKVKKSACSCYCSPCVCVKPKVTYQKISPLTLDLNNTGIVTDSRVQRSFDIDNDGKLDKIDTVAKGQAELAFDLDRNGIAGERANELFGNFTGTQIGTNAMSFKNGFDALKDVAGKVLGQGAIMDGKLDAHEIKQLEASIGFGAKIDGQLKTLSQLGITSMDLNASSNQQKTVGRSVYGETASFTQNGVQKKNIDVYYEKQ